VAQTLIESFVAELRHPTFFQSFVGEFVGTAVFLFMLYTAILPGTNDALIFRVATTAGASIAVLVSVSTYTCIIKHTSSYSCGSEEAVCGSSSSAAARAKGGGSQGGWGFAPLFRTPAAQTTLPATEVSQLC
jgi:hypothetical protein